MTRKTAIRLIAAVAAGVLGNRSPSQTPLNGTGGANGTIPAPTGKGHLPIKNGTGQDYACSNCKTKTVLAIGYVNDITLNLDGVESFKVTLRGVTITIPREEIWAAMNSKEGGSDGGR